MGKRNEEKKQLQLINKIIDKIDKENDQHISLSVNWISNKINVYCQKAIFFY